MGQSRRSRLLLALGLVGACLAVLAVLFLLRHEEGEEVRSASGSGFATAPDSVAALPDPAMDNSEVQSLGEAARTVAEIPTTTVESQPDSAQCVFVGRLLDAAGSPLNGAEVICLPNWKSFNSLGMDPELLLMPSTRGEWRDAVKASLPAVVSSADGSFELPVQLWSESSQYDQPLPSYPQLLMLKPGYETTAVPCKGFGRSIERFNVGDVVLPAVPPLSGHVMNNDGKPASNVVVVPVTWRRTSGLRDTVAPIVARLIAARTNESGSFVFASLPAGKGRLRFLPVEWCPLDAAATHPQEQPISAVTVEKGNAIHGVVTGESGKLLAAASVTFLDSVPYELAKDREYLHYAALTSTDFASAPSVLTNDKGFFQYDCLGISTTAALVSCKGYEPTIVAPLAEELNVALEPQGTAFASVIDAQSGQPIRNATVHAWRHVVGANGGMLDPRRARDIELPVDALSEDSNRTHVIREVCSAGLIVAAEAKSFASNVRIVDRVAADESAVIEVLLHPEGIIVGTVKSLSGDPFEGIQITASFKPRAPTDAGGLHDPPGAEGRTMDLSQDEARYLAEVLPRKVTVTDRRGEYVLHDLRAGTWELEPLATNYLSVQPALVDVVAGQTARGDLTLTRACTIEGRVLGNDERPLANAYVALRRVTPPATDGQGFAATFADAAGAFRFPLLLDGLYEVSPVQVGDPVSVAVAPGEVVQVTLRQWAESSIQGTVGSPSGPVAGVAVLLETVATSLAPTARAITDDRGRYSLKGPWQGKFRLKCGPINGVVLAPQTVTLSPADSVTVDFWLGGCALECRAISVENGESIAPCRGRLRLADGDYGPYIESDAAGVVRFENTPPGTYVVQLGTVAVEGRRETYYLSAESNALVIQEPCEGYSLTVPLERGAIVQVHIVSSVGKPLPAGLRVSVAKMDGERRYTRWATPVNGSCFVGDLLAGRHSVALVKGTSILWQQDVVLENGTEQQVTAVIGG